MSTRLGDDVYGERTLTAEQYADGTLDWYAFDVNGEINMGTPHDPPGAITTRTVIPAPVTIHGMPSPRFWELEDARIDLGALQPGATDLPQLLLVETLSGYGNDWYVIPIDLPVGSLAESRSLVVTDTFGVQTLDPTHRRPRHRARGGWSMYSLSLRFDAADATGVPVTNLFFLPPTIRPLEGPVLEEVCCCATSWPTSAGQSSAGWRARWSWAWRPRWTWSTWRPHPGRQVTCRCTGWRRPSRSTGCRSSPCACGRRRRGPPGPRRRLPATARRSRTAQARLHDVGDPAGRLLIREEEVPREGVVVRRTYQAARWQTAGCSSGSEPRAVGRGEGSSGLAFDALEG